VRVPIAARVCTSVHCVFTSHNALVLLTAAALVGVSGCSTARDAVSTDLQTNRDGVLMVAASLPSPGFWNHATPDSLDGGFEWALAAELAERFDLTLEVVDVAFTDIIAGDLQGADLALAQIVPTPERQESVAFAGGYLASDFGVLVRDGETVRDLATARRLSWSTVESSLEQGVLIDIVRPIGGIEAVSDEVDAADLVRSGVVDAALIDLPSALVIAGADEALTVASRIQTEGRYAPAFPIGSANIELIDAALRAFEADGTLARLEQTWLEAVYERPAGAVPVIVTKQAVIN
jgi:polar amino acid transport system substrate-binding protein